MLSDTLRWASAALYSTPSRFVQYSAPPVYLTKMNNIYACDNLKEQFYILNIIISFISSRL